MKKVVLSIFAVATLSACAVSYPQSSAELRNMASSSALVKAQSYTVSRSTSSVTSNLRTLAHKCLNRTSRANQTYRVGAYGPQSLLWVTKYQTSVRSTGNGSELVMRMIPIRGGINEPKEGYIFFVADVKPGSAGTTVTHYQGSIGGKEFSSAVREWSNGATRTCPQMPR